MSSWTLDDIPWEKFDRAKVDPEILRLIKASSLVEQNGGDYAQYLCSVFHDDPAFAAVARRWGAEEEQHGQALGRCIVETGTSSFYMALAEVSDEPVLKEICKRLAADELRHYRLFYTHLQRYLVSEPLGLWGRLRIAAGRIGESEADDELPYAYFAANENAAPYDRRRHARAYLRRTYGVYRWHHIERSIAMVFKAVGLKPHGRLNLWTARLAWWSLQRRAGRLARLAA